MAWSKVYFGVWRCCPNFEIHLVIRAQGQNDSYLLSSDGVKLT